MLTRSRVDGEFTDLLVDLEQGLERINRFWGYVLGAGRHKFHSVNNGLVLAIGGSFDRYGSRLLAIAFDFAGYN